MKIRTLFSTVIFAAVLVSGAALVFIVNQWGYRQSIQYSVEELNREIQTLESSLYSRNLFAYLIELQTGTVIPANIESELTRTLEVLLEWNMEFEIYSRRGIIFPVELRYPKPPEVLAVTNADIRYVLRSDGEHFTLWAAKEFIPGYGDYVIRMSRDITGLRNDYRRRLYVSLLFVLILALLFLPLIYLISSRMVRSIIQLQYAMQSFSRDTGDGSDLELSAVHEISSIQKQYLDLRAVLSRKIDELNGEVRRRNEFFERFDHELNTPLTSIIGYASRIRTTSTAAESHAAEKIIAAARRLELLKGRLQDMYQVNSGDDWSVFDLGALLRECWANLSFEADGKELRAELPAGTARVFANQGLMDSLLKNLLHNAIKASPADGSISSAILRENNRFMLRIEDSGPGMPADQIEELNNLSYEKSPASYVDSSHGKGLILCKEIINYHKCSWHFHNNPGGGLCVDLDFTNILHVH